MKIDFEKIIINYIKKNIKSKKKINKNTLFTEMNGFDSLNFVKLVIFLNKYSVKFNTEELSKVSNIKDLSNACKKNKK